MHNKTTKMHMVSILIFFYSNCYNLPQVVLLHIPAVRQAMNNRTPCVMHRVINCLRKLNRLQTFLLAVGT